MLEFGTAGIRGIMGPGDDQINIEVVKNTTQALANFLKKKNAGNDADISVVISYDSRNNSFDFAKCAAGVLVGNGIRAILFPEMMPVPVLSYSTRKLQCSAGIMITASHNPKQYNGYKVYGPNGGQILEKDAKSIQDEISAIVKSKDAIHFSESYELADMTVYEDYRRDMERASAFSSERELEIVYTPLNGSGRRPVTDMFKENGFRYKLVSEQEMPDGNFTTCPSPNPEKEEVYEIALKYATGTNGEHADLIIATDPDCDRVGCMVWDVKAQKYTLLSGNEIGTLMTYFLCKKVKNTKGDTVVCSLVSTPIIEKIADSFGCSVIRTPVGFKYVGDTMDTLGDRFIFGFEESNGFLTGDYARDKDGIVGAKIVCQMAAYYKAIGKTLSDVLREIYDKYGMILNKTVSKDLKTGEEKPKMTVTSYEDGSRVIVRPSGTEPKVKYYFSAPDEKRLAELEALWC